MPTAFCGRSKTSGRNALLSAKFAPAPGRRRFGRKIFMARQVPIAVLISGSGTNLQSSSDAIEGKRLDARIEIVLSNRPDAYGLVRAKNHSIATTVLDHKSFPDRGSYDQAVVDLLRARGVELVVLAGFMRLLSPV